MRKSVLTAEQEDYIRANYKDKTIREMEAHLKKYYQYIHKFLDINNLEYKRDEWQKRKSKEGWVRKQKG